MLFRLTSFLGAFLLFGLQPLAGRAVLPLFGGGAGAWMVCLLFFQVVLLGGYGAVHGLLARGGTRWRGIYGGLALLALGSLAFGGTRGGAPLLPGPHTPGANMADPALGVLSVLGLTVGLPLLVLATTSPLVQACHRQAHPDGDPYPLYATSNWGSMAGLLTYPLVLEPFLGLRLQAWAAALLFCAYLSLMGVLLHRHAPRTWAAAPDSEPTPSTPPRSFLGWTGLAALGTAWLMVVSNSLSLSFASVPLLWILPLMLYLATFILAFEGARNWARPGLWLLAGSLILSWILVSNTWFLWSTLIRRVCEHVPGFSEGAMKLIQFIRSNTIIFELCLPLAALFTTGLAIHSHLARVRPHPSRLTSFYLAIALGGVGGGLAIGLLAPWVFRQHLENFILLVLTGGLILRGTREKAPASIQLGGLLIGLPLVLLASLLLILAVDNPTVLKARDYFGAVEVSKPHPKILQLRNGNTIHGIQYLDMPLVPAGYYGETSGMGLALRARQAERPAMRVGVVGLGVGSTAAYARPGDTYEFYEISRKMIELAGMKPRAFRVLSSAPGTIRVHEGDGRKLLEAEAPASFDALVIDAFAGGHIPTHLLTREAMELYLRALHPDGILIVHASHDLPLAEQVMAQVRDLGLWAVWLRQARGVTVVDLATRYPVGVDYPSSYLVIARTPWPLAQKAFDPLLAGALGPRGVPASHAAGLHDVVRATRKRLERVRAWTDDRNSLLPLLLAARK